MNTNTWHQALYDCEQKGLAYVLVTVIQSAGSTPRDAGTKMVVSGDSQFDTIGGGHLEYEAIAQARQLLAKGDACQEVISFPLSSKLGQCCGGAVKLLFEVMLQHRQHLAIFGAGHVAQALVPILAQLPIQITWIDSREDMFNQALQMGNSLGQTAQKISDTYSNVRTMVSETPYDEIKHLPENAWVVILTHNHQLDYDIVKTALKHTSIDFVGMIGSKTKAKRFATKLAHRGFTPAQIKRLVSPVGDLSIVGKKPIEVAVSIAAQLIALLNDTPEQTQNNTASLDQNTSHSTNISKVSWSTPLQKNIQQLIQDSKTK